MTIHSLWSECSSNQKYLTTCQNFTKSLIQLNNSDLKESLLLGNYSLSFSSVKISTHLFIFRRINKRPLSKFDESFLFEESKLPSYERIIVRIEICGDKWSAMVTMQAQLFDIFSSERWEVLDPEIGISKFGYYFLGEFHLAQNVILIDKIVILLDFHLFILFLLTIFCILTCFLLLCLKLLFWLVLILLLLLFNFFLLIIGFWDSRFQVELWRKTIGS